MEFRYNTIIVCLCACAILLGQVSVVLPHLAGSFTNNHKQPRLLLLKNFSRYLTYLVKGNKGFRFPHEVSQSYLENRQRENEQDEKNKHFIFTVRVLLDEKKVPFDAPWIIRSSKGFILYTLDEPIRKIVYRTPTITIMHSARGVLINGKRCLCNRFIIEPIEDYLIFDGNKYQGSFYIAHEDDTY